MDDVQRSRLGLEQEAMSVVEPEPAAKPLVLPRPREFNEFTLEPGKRHNLFSSRLLGNLLKHFVVGAVVIDPNILHSSQQIGVLEGFLRVLKIAPEIEVKIKGQPVLQDHSRAGPVRVRCRVPPTISRGMVRSHSERVGNSVINFHVRRLKDGIQRLVNQKI